MNPKDPIQPAIPPSAADNEKDNERLSQIQDYYDSTYHAGTTTPVQPGRHYQRLAQRMGINADDKVLDVACGNGEWLLACQQQGAEISGADLSNSAIAACRNRFPKRPFHVSPAEKLPFEDSRFTFVSCLGSLEHFVDPLAALTEMIRVARPDARFLLLVPNADFLTRRLGLFAGTDQVDAREEVLPLAEWQALFSRSGLEIEQRWRDLHVLSRNWILARGWGLAIPRAIQALLLAIWPLRWQYQVYHLCRLSPNATASRKD